MRLLPETGANMKRKTPWWLDIKKWRWLKAFAQCCNDSHIHIDEHYLTIK